MDMNIKVSAKNVYGVTKVYPECEKAKLFAKIAGTTILTDQTLKLIGKLGYGMTLVLKNDINLEQYDAKI